jgi:predicted DNA-binding transcriptional regulator YafY
MRRADRLFQIVQFLRTRRVTTAHWLAERLEVSERTIYRDIQDLLANAVPIEGEAGVGYVIRKGYDLPPLMFTTEELSALALGASIVDSWADLALSTAAQSALSKIESSLPGDLKGYLADSRLLSPMQRLSAETAHNMAELRRAMEERAKLRIAYQRLDGEHSERIIWPLGLFFWGQVWTLGGWCEKRKALRNFRLDRIRSLEWEGQTYPDMPGRRLQDLIEQGKQQYSRRS